MNSCSSSILAAAWAAAHSAGRAPAVRAAASSSSRPGRIPATTSQRNWRTNHAGEVDGATSSTRAKSAPPALAARSTVKPSAPQSRAELTQQQVGAWALRKRDADHWLVRLAEQAVRLRLQRRQAVVERRADPGGSGRRGKAVKARLEQGRARRRGRERPAPRSAASRSIAWLSRRRTSGSSSRPPARTGTSPNRPDAGSKRRLPRGGFTRCAKGRSAKVPPSTRSDLPAAKALDRCLRRSRPRAGLLRGSSPRRPRGETISRVSRSSLPSAPARELNGPGAEAVAQDRKLRLGEQRRAGWGAARSAGSRSLGRSSRRCRRPLRACP